MLFSLTRVLFTLTGVLFSSVQFLYLVTWPLPTIELGVTTNQSAITLTLHSGSDLAWKTTRSEVTKLFFMQSKSVTRFMSAFYCETTSSKVTGKNELGISLPLVLSLTFG